VAPQFSKGIQELHLMAIQPVDPKKADKRTAERYIRTGMLDESEYRKQVEQLPDLADKAAPVETKMYTLEEELEDEEDFEDEESDEESDEDAAERTDEA
jgi:hypothetical protein